MYHRQNTNNEKPLQMVDFYSLRKKVDEYIIRYENNKITISGDYQCTILIILAFFQFTSGVQINEDIFDKFNLEHNLKNFQQYAHQKTMKVLLKTIIEKNDSIDSLIEVINEFPIVVFILESYCRIKCLKFIQQNKDIELWGNERKILEDLTLQIRGNLLGIMANSLGMQITLKNGQNVETYGHDKNPRKIQITLSQAGIQGKALGKKDNPQNSIVSRHYQSSGTKKLKQIGSKQTEVSESGQTTTEENSSLLLKQSVLSDTSRCEKCKQFKTKCLCIKKTLNSPYNTPKSGTKLQRSPIQSNPFSLNVINQSKCTCGKIICICRR